jgi:glutamate-ammonia-ligase adenylyltransferase
MELTTTFAEHVSPVLAASRYLQRELQARPWLPPQLATTYSRPLDSASMLDFLRSQVAAGGDLKRGLRRLRSWVVCHTACRDLLGMAPLAEVFLAMTRLAEVSLLYARDLLQAKLAEVHGNPVDAQGRPMEMTIVGMGKLGGSELNVSSDIDLIFLYPEEGETSGPRSLGHCDFFSKLGRLLIAAIGEVTEDGFVFRVDMRLRPNGDSGPLVTSFAGLERYFIAQGREWERFAWIKARPLCGNRLDELEAIVRPFVFRKYLDFGVINGLRALHAQMRAQVVRREMAMNIKLGPGGIREIEFLAQMFQIIRGGRDLDLQQKSTLPVLAALRRHQVLDGNTVLELEGAYVFLRSLEHRLQYLDDAQTHDLPASAEDRRCIAETMHFPDEAALLRKLEGHRARVDAAFRAACGDPSGSGHLLDELWLAQSTPEHVVERLRSLQFVQPEASGDRLLQVRRAGSYRHLPEDIRSRFDALIPRLIEWCAKEAVPDTALARSLTLLETISRRGAYLALLQQYPQALRRMVELVSASGWAAEYLVKHPILLDELLDGRHLGEVTDWPAFVVHVRRALDAVEPDTERQMDLLREQHHVQVFRLLHQDIAGKWRVEEIGDHLSALADVILGETMHRCWQKYERRHCDAPCFAIIGYGKLGGKELGYGSDLDLIFLYNDDHDAAAENYARLAQRMLTWLTTRTTAGSLFDIDTRLRPNGGAGLLVSHLQSFLNYQDGSARLWEHQALTRARFVAGDLSIGRAFEQARETILCRPRQAAQLAEEVIAMRRRLLDSHASRGAGFNLKDDVGGLVDFEFIIQYLILGNADKHPRLVANLGNIALAAIAADLGLVAAEPARAAADGYRSLRRHQHRLRLNGEKGVVPAEEVAPARQAIIDLWQEVFGRAA